MDSIYTATNRISLTFLFCLFNDIAHCVVLFPCWQPSSSRIIFPSIDTLIIFDNSYVKFDLFNHYFFFVIWWYIMFVWVCVCVCVTWTILSSYIIIHQCICSFPVLIDSCTLINRSFLLQKNMVVNFLKLLLLKKIIT